MSVITLEGDDLLHDAGLHKPDLHRVADNEVGVSKLQALVGGESKAAAHICRHSRFRTPVRNH